MKRAPLIFALAAAACTYESRDLEFEIGARERTSPALATFGSCDELHTALRGNLQEEMTAQLLQTLEQNNYWGPIDVGFAAEGAPAADTRQEGVDFSGTNNQETGVDEADFVKTDGFYIYALNGNRLEIFGVPTFGDLDHLSTTPLEGYPSQMLQSGDQAAVFSRIYTWTLPEDHPLFGFVTTPAQDTLWWYPSEVLTKITVLDLSDRNAPRVTREVYLEGHYQTARKVDTTVRFVSYAFMQIDGLRYWPELPDSYWDANVTDDQRDEMFRRAVFETIRDNNDVIATTELGNYVPAIYERYGDTIISHPFNAGGCNNFAIAGDGLGRGVTSIMSLDLLGNGFSFDADHIVSNWSTVYASTDTLLIAENAHDFWWFWGAPQTEEATNIHRFDISTAGQSTYTGSGRVRGQVFSQFQLSEYEGTVRVASSSGRWGFWWLETPPEPESHVTTLAGSDSLEIQGHLGGIAPGEAIWSARFVGPKAYLVTFRNIDPLWTIDLSDPSAPRIEGELEVPGVSTYIHPTDTDQLLTIGYGGDANGLNWSTEVSLFGVADFQNPTLDHRLSLNPGLDPTDGWTWSYSEATWEHKAFQYWAPKEMLAIPLSTYRWDYQWSDYEYVSKLQLISVNPTGGLSFYGSVDHSAFFNNDGSTYWEYRDVRRSIFMGDYIYAISDRGITSHLLSDLSLSASHPLPGSTNGWYWYY